MKSKEKEERAKKARHSQNNDTQWEGREGQVEVSETHKITSECNCNQWMCEEKQQQLILRGKKKKKRDSKRTFCAIIFTKTARETVCLLLRRQLRWRRNILLHREENKSERQLNLPVLPLYAITSTLFLSPLLSLFLVELLIVKRKATLFSSVMWVKVSVHGHWNIDFSRLLYC